MFRTLLKLLSVLAMFALVSPLAAQTVAAPPASDQTAPLAAPAQAIDPSSAEVAKTGKAAVAVGVHDLSPWAMFRNADIIVQLVMLGLAFASLVTWTVAIAKTMELTASQRRLKTALTRITDSRSLAEAQLALGKKDTVLSVLLAAALKEGRMSVGISSDAGIKERAASSFSEIMRAEARRIRFGMGALATIGATSPFVGLFGTVWGIMNSFIGISKSQTTNLAVVAPGIAEALLATAIGLVAAIPAVIIYNHFARVTKTYMEYVNRASGAAGRLLSRDLDRTQHGIPHSRAAE